MGNNRYLRHNLIDWFSQDLLNQSSFAVIGAGAIGNEVIKNLTLLGVGTIHVFDFDTIEIHNLTRSVLFREENIGRNKAEIAVENGKKLDPNVQLLSFEGDFWETLSLAQLKEYSAVFCCVDNFEARIKLNEMCFLAGVNLINTAIDSRFSSIEFFPYSKGIDEPCYECGLPNSVYESISNRYSCGWLKKKALAEKVVPTTIVTSSVSGAMAVSVALEGLSDNEQEAKRILFDTKSGRSTVTNIKKNIYCPCCSKYKDKPIIIKTKNNIRDLHEIENGNTSGDFTFYFADQIIVDMSCKNECNINVSDYLFKATHNFDDSLYKCSNCRNLSIKIKVKDQFSTEELLHYFSAVSVPTKYVVSRINNKTYCFDLEESI